MIPVMMNGPIEADGQQSGCFEACLASILEVPAESIPRLYRDTMPEFWGAVTEWAETAGVELTTVINPQPSSIAGFHIRALLVKHAELGEAAHAVVYCGKKMVHDPGIVKRKKIREEWIMTVNRHNEVKP